MIKEVTLEIEQLEERIAPSAPPYVPGLGNAMDHHATNNGHTNGLENAISNAIRHGKWPENGGDV